jgi:hypothetical protein
VPASANSSGRRIRRSVYSVGVASMFFVAP